MADKAKNNRINFRPHFKTHQSAEIGNWFREIGVDCITVSSVQMAEYFAQAGWEDILIAFPINLLEMDQINYLAQKVNLHLLLESIESAKFLDDNLKFPSGIYLKIDTGYHRTGLLPGDDEIIYEILSILKQSKNLSFTGILTHAGNAYNTNNIEEILDIHKNSIEQLLKVKKMVLAHFPNCIVSVGDTPTCSLAKDYTSVDEIRPGNFVFYDIMQYQLGSCKLDQIAVSLACPVVAKHQSRNEIVIYGGGIHLSKEAILDERNRKVFGLVVKLTESGWGQPLASTYISSLSQEHGIIKTSPENFGQIHIGEAIGILPIHSCLTANLMNSYTTLDNKIIPKFKFNSRKN